MKIYSPHQEIILSSIMPIMESFGFNVIKEHTYAINVEEDLKNRSIKKAWIHYFHLNLSKNGGELTEKIKENFETTIDLIWKNVTKIGALNKLLIACNLDWKQIFMLRGYVKYLYQAGFRGKEHRLAWIVAMGESTGRPKAFNGPCCHGLFQINMSGNLKADRLKRYGLKSVTDLYNPLVNSKVAFKMSRKGTNWSAWTVNPYKRSGAEYPGVVTKQPK